MKSSGFKSTSCKLKTHISKCSYFSLALSGSVDVTDISQVMTFARPVSENFDFHEELLAIHPLPGGTKGSDIYEANFVVSEIGGLKNCSCVVTDGAKAIVGKQNGLVRLPR